MTKNGVQLIYLQILIFYTTQHKGPDNIWSAVSVLLAREQHISIYPIHYDNICLQPVYLCFPLGFHLAFPVDLLVTLTHPLLGPPQPVL